jgi:hypothetical protein
MKNNIPRLIALIGIAVLLSSCSPTSEYNDTIELMRKEITISSCPIIFDEEITAESLAKDWTVHHSEWWVEDGWLYGKNPGTHPGMVILNRDFPGNVLVEFEASTVAPSTHDINVMWNGEWLDSIDQRGLAYVAGLEGWQKGKVGIEKSPEYKLMVGTPLLDFQPGELYHIVAGSINGHCFMFANGQLLLEAMDPDPIDNQKYMKVGLEAFSSYIKVRNFKIRQIEWKEIKTKYQPEF